MRILLVRYLAIGMAGFLGAIARFAIAQIFGHWFNIRFPLATLFINVTGSFLLGWFLPYAIARDVSDTTRLAIGTGFVGAYTTFSTLMFESNTLVEEGAGMEATINLIGSLILGMIAVRLGMGLARRA